MRQYRGLTIHIETWPRGGKWNWAYTIEGYPRTANPDVLAPTQLLAEDDAFEAARRDLDGDDEMFDEEPNPEEGFEHNW